MARKSLFHVERFDSLHRHQVSVRYINQQHSDAALRQIRLDSTESDPAKATGGQHTSVLTDRPGAIWWDDISREAYLIWFWVGVAVITAIVSGLIYRGVREMRILRMAGQYWCHNCRRGTDWSADKSRCLECPAEPPV